MRVLIQGAGPAGLTLALVLERAGVAVQVVDRARPGRRDGYAVGIHANGWRAAERLDLIPALRAREMPLGAARYLHRDGRPHLAYDYRDLARALAGRTLAILRDDLQDVFDAAASGIAIDYGTSIAALSETESGITAELSSGAVWSGDLVVGADGYRSGLRRMLFADEALRPLGYRVAAWRYRPDRPLPASVTGMAAVDHHASLYTLPDGQAATLFCWRDDDETRLDPAERQALLTRVFGEWLDPIGGAVAGMAGAEVFLDTVAQVELPQWSRGRAVLLGNSAWCLTFMSGQGTSLAMAGAMVLADELARQPVAQALQRYEARLRPTVTRMQAAARQIGGQFVPASRFGMRMQGLLAPLLFSRPLLPLVARRMMPPEIAF